MSQWPRLLCSKDAPGGVLCTSEVHREMLGPTWFEMPAAFVDVSQVGHVGAKPIAGGTGNSFKTEVNNDLLEAAPATVIPARNETKKPRKRGHA